VIQTEDVICTMGGILDSSRTDKAVGIECRAAAGLEMYLPLITDRY